MLKIRNVESTIDYLFDKVIEFNDGKYFFRSEKNGQVSLNCITKTGDLVYPTLSANTLFRILEDNFTDDELLRMKWNGNFIFKRTNEWEMKGNLAEIELVRHDDGKDDPEKEFTIYTKNEDGESVACFFSLHEMRKIAEKLNELVK